MAKRPFSRLVKIVSGLRAGAEGEWHRAENEFSRLERFAHFWVLVGTSFVRNRCPVRAAALSYTTLLALIPLLAVAISVTSSLLKSEGEQKIYEAIDKFVSNVMPPARLDTHGPGRFAEPRPRPVGRLDANQFSSCRERRPTRPLRRRTEPRKTKLRSPPATMPAS